MYDIIIVGAGPAGLTAAIYALRASKKVLVFEAKSYGGQIINTLDIENYPAISHISGFDFAASLYEQAKNLGAIIKFEEVIQIKDGKNEKIVITNNSQYLTKTIILATGCRNRKLEINEDRYLGRGLSYCATCDGSFFKGQTVAVVGGGNTAFHDALYLSDIAKKVYLIHRNDTFRGDAKDLRLLKQKENVEFLLNSKVIKVNGKDILESVEINTSGSNKILALDGLFVAIGKIPENNLFKELIQIDDSGYACAKEDCHSNKAGIFVAGDVRKKDVRQLVTATSDGAVAAIEAVNYLNNLQCKK